MHYIKVLKDQRLIHFMTFCTVFKCHLKKLNLSIVDKDLPVRSLSYSKKFSHTASLLHNFNMLQNIYWIHLVIVLFIEPLKTISERQCFVSTILEDSERECIMLLGWVL